MNTLDMKRANGQTWMQAINRAYYPWLLSGGRTENPLPDYRWYHEGVAFCLSNGVLTAEAGGFLRLSDTMTRAETVEMLWKLNGEPEVPELPVTNGSAPTANDNSVPTANDSGTPTANDGSVPIGTESGNAAQNADSAAAGDSSVPVAVEAGVENAFAFDPEQDSAVPLDTAGETGTAGSPSDDGSVPLRDSATVVEEVPVEEVPFEDIPAGASYEKAVRWARRMGIIEGTSPTTFNPSGLLNRQQFAAILYRAVRPEGTYSGLDAFPDAGQVSVWARDAMAWCVENGLIQGKSDKNLHPVDTISRAQAAVIIFRYSQLTQEKPEAGAEAAA